MVLMGFTYLAGHRLVGPGSAWYVGDPKEELRMPFVNIRLYEGHGKERKDELAKRITQAVTDVCQVPPQAVWVVFEEVPPTDWFAAGAPGQPVKK